MVETVKNTTNNGNVPNEYAKLYFAEKPKEPEPVLGSVFAGAKGSSSTTPYVKGNITVNINNGSIANVYGAFDKNGINEGTVNVISSTLTDNCFIYAGDNIDIAIKCNVTDMKSIDKTASTINGYISYIQNQKININSKAIVLILPNEKKE